MKGKKIAKVAIIITMVIFLGTTIGSIVMYIGDTTQSNSTGSGEVVTGDTATEQIQITTGDTTTGSITSTGNIELSGEQTLTGN